MGYVFDPKVLHEIANRAIGLPFEEMVKQVTNDCHEAYPRHVSKDTDWLFNFAAGAKGCIKIMHGSLSEYLLLFGTPLGTEGFSGRYRLDIYDFMIQGEMWTFLDDNIGEKIVSKPGDYTLLRNDQTKGYKLPVGSWMLEYARGAVPTALPLGLGDAVFSCQDPYTVYKTLKTYGKLVVKELMQGKI